MNIIGDKEFSQARKCLEARNKRLTKNMGNKSNAAEALTEDEVNILYENYLH